MPVKLIQRPQAPVALPTLESQETSKNHHVGSGLITTGQLKTLRVTSLVVLGNCLRSWQAKYLASTLEKPRASSDIGTWVHEICESYLKGEFELRTPRWAEIMKRLQAEKMPLDEIVSLEIYLDKLTHHRRHLAVLEYEFALEVPGVPKPLVGHIDMISVPEPQVLIITDHKTNRKAKPLEWWKRNLQPRWYAYAARRLWPGHRVMFRIGYVNLRDWRHWETDPSGDAALEEWLRHNWQVILECEETGIWPATPSDEACQFCPIKTTCDANLSRAADFRTSLGLPG